MAKIDDESPDSPPMAVILVDLDEVLFPFAHTYAQYRARLRLSPIPEEAWRNYTIGETLIPGHQDVMQDFFHDAETLATPPISAAVEALRPLAERHTIIGCTGRYAETEGPGTLTWVNLHTPWVSHVEFVNWHPESQRPSPKGTVAKNLNSVALIDDAAVHLRNLPDGVHGLLVRRPPGVPSEPEAYPWSIIRQQLNTILH